MKTGIIVLAHGSKVDNGNNGLFKIVEMLKIMNKWECVEAGFLQLARPSLIEAIEKVVKGGAKRVIIIPLLLFSGNHVQKDIPCEIKEQRKRYPDVQFFYAKNLGPDERIAQIATDRINDVIREEISDSSGWNEILPSHRITDPDSITRESFNIIDKLIDLIGERETLSINLPIVKRVIHATGDLEYAKNLIFFNDAVKSGVEAIRNASSIVTDVNMVKTGINKKIMNHFGGRVICKIADKAIVSQAKKNGETRAIAAINESLSEINGGIIAIGNAPSALFHLVDLVNKEKVTPALIIGVPVGFVGASESKEALRKTKIPFIANVGRKGGSAVAVTIVNALLNLAILER